MGELGDSGHFVAVFYRKNWTLNFRSGQAVCRCGGRSLQTELKTGFLCWRGGREPGSYRRREMANLRTFSGVKALAFQVKVTSFFFFFWQIQILYIIVVTHVNTSPCQTNIQLLSNFAHDLTSDVKITWRYSLFSYTKLNLLQHAIFLLFRRLVDADKR